MIKKLKRKFVLLATASLLILMTVLIAAINAINFATVIRETDNVLSVLSEFNTFFRDTDKHIEEGKPEQGRGMRLPDGMSPEVPYESRFFTVTVSADGDILETDVERIVSVDGTEVEKYARAAAAKRSARGFVGRFRFAKFADGSAERIVFLDCGRLLDSFFHFFRTSVIIGFAGCAAVFLIFLLAANRIVRPIAESYEKQKRFITDASHEIKTPLTVIAANTDLLSADFGENECLSDIREQVTRLTALTADLVSLARMDEAGTELMKTVFPISDLIAEEAASFRLPMEAARKIYTVEITPELSANGSPNAFRQLVSILLDNALKYSPEGGTVTLRLTAVKKAIRLTVSNTVNIPVTPEDLPRLFDRFYRTDSSRSSETGGHGIGLSLAKAIVDAHGGKITASMRDGSVFTVSALFPV